MDKAINLLLLEKSIESDLTNPDFGIPYALEIQKQSEKAENKQPRGKTTGY